MKTKIVKYTTTKAKVVDKRVLRFIGSDQKTDRDGDKIMTSGWNLKNYKDNPVILFGHDYTGSPVARAKKVWVDSEKKNLMFDVEFPEADVSSVGDSLYKLYKAGYMKAVSVGFVPNIDKIEYPNRKKGSNQPWRIFNEQELLELSLVSIPANPRAVLTSKSVRKAIDENIIDELELNELLDCFLDKNKKADDVEKTMPIEKNEDGSLKVVEDNYTEEKQEQINKTEVDSDLVKEINKIKDELNLLKDIVSVKNTDKVSYIDKLFDETYDEFVASKDTNTDSNSKEKSVDDLCEEILTEVNKDGQS